MTAAIIIIVCCWIISFFFNGIESGLLSIDPVRLRQNVKRRLPAALQLNRLLKRPERLLATVLLVTNAADIVALLLLNGIIVGGLTGIAIAQVPGPEQRITLRRGLFVGHVCVDRTLHRRENHHIASAGALCFSR